MRKSLVVLLLAASLAAAGCSGDSGQDDNAACVESLDRQQHEVGSRAVGEVATAAGIIEGAVDAARNGRLQQRDRQLLRSAQRRLDRLEEDLEQAFNTGCA